MTDKQIKDPCDTCKVEPPQLKFKCPTCEHNPDFEKDINVPSKQIIISDYFTATLTLPEKIVEYQLKPYRDNQLVEKINEQNSYLKRKEQECERLKATIQLQNKMQMEVCEEKNKEIETLSKINKANAKSYKKFYYKHDQYKQALKEIKEIAKKCCINQATSDCEDFKNCEECGRISDSEGIKQILQICDEVSNANIQS